MVTRLRSLAGAVLQLVRHLDAAAASGSISNAKAATHETSKQVSLRTYAITDAHDPFKRTA